ncbi:hypothetical protein BROUX41_005807 [Berkeleyomyces rouxiae]|uniref:uncharacterized protein n=1 Tax=Berkeleyomyces rouxiae TaxID=2035830 RepID=UPI003B7F48EF
MANKSQTEQSAQPANGVKKRAGKAEVKKSYANALKQQLARQTRAESPILVEDMDWSEDLVLDSILADSPASTSAFLNDLEEQEKKQEEEEAPRRLANKACITEFCQGFDSLVAKTRVSANSDQIASFLEQISVLVMANASKILRPARTTRGLSDSRWAGPATQEQDTAPAATEPAPQPKSNKKTPPADIQAPSSSAPTSSVVEVPDAEEWTEVGPKKGKKKGSKKKAQAKQPAPAEVGNNNKNNNKNGKAKSKPPSMDARVFVRLQESSNLRAIHPLSLVEQINRLLPDNCGVSEVKHVRSGPALAPYLFIF